MKEQHVSQNDDSLMLDETRVARLEDAVAIASAKMSCVRELDAAINSGHVPDTPPPTASPDLIIELISQINTTWRYPEFAQMLRRVSFSHCFLGSEQINFDADNDDVAQGHWVSWHPLTYDGAAWLLAGRYRDTFTRQNSQWRLTSIEFTPEICTRWDEGWGTNRIAQELRSHVPD